MIMQATSSLYRPMEDNRVPVGTLAYFQARNRSRIYEAVIEEFLKSGITQATLARRMGKGTDVVCRLLGAPGNWTLDTVSDLLFAISGGEPEYSVSYPFERPARNYVTPNWLTRLGGGQNLFNGQMTAINTQSAITHVTSMVPAPDQQMPTIAGFPHGR